MSTLPAKSILKTDARNILGLIDSVATSLPGQINGCLDIGCGYNPLSTWFGNQTWTKQPAFYIGVDDDHRIHDALRGRVDVRRWDTLPDGFKADLVIACEVLEHIQPHDSMGLLAGCKERTGKVFALTTPNFEDWGPKYALERELRFIPDHLRDFNAGSTDAFVHKQRITPLIMHAYLAEAFPDDAWEHRVYRAWPWELRDVPANRTHHVFFKVFGICWRRQT